MEQMKILHFEDDLATSKLVERIIANRIPESEYLHEEVPYCASPIIALEQPDILICDYQFEHATLREGLLDGIRRCKGIIYVLSSHSKATIEKLVPELPTTVRVFNKTNVAGLIDDICECTLVV